MNFVTAEDIKAAIRDVDQETKAVIMPDPGARKAVVAAFNAVNDHLHANSLTKAALCPPVELTFRAFVMTPISRMRAVLIAQDPYIHAGEATGLAFSVPRVTGKVPPSLRMIYKCLVARGLIAAEPEHGDLTMWARQGILLLNAALTTVLGKSNAHAEIWREYTSSVVAAISRAKPGTAFILLGREAQRFEQVLAPGSVVLKWGHPSPLNQANCRDCPENFVNCDAFEKVAIDWNPDAAPSECILFTDGACRGNGKGEKSVASWAYVACTADRTEVARDSGIVPTNGPLKGSIIHATNNRGELLAILHGLRAVASRFDKVRVVTDSEYSIGCITEWYAKWIREGTQDDKKNTDILADIERVKSRFVAVEFAHIKSHESTAPTGREWEWAQNAIVDGLAQAVTEQHQ